MYDIPDICSLTSAIWIPAIYDIPDILSDLPIG